MVEKVLVTSRQSYYYGKPEDHPFRNLLNAIQNGDDVWYEFTDGAREGSIAKVMEISEFSGYSDNLYLPTSFMVEVSPDKTIKVGVKAYHNNLTFLLGYTGSHVVKFEKGKPKAVITETKTPDLLGNNIKIGDWVIYQPKGRYGAPGLGRLNRLSAAGNAWVIMTNKQGNEVEVQTDGASTLIKVAMTPELHTTYMLCDTLTGLRTKLVIDLDHDAY